MFNAVEPIYNKFFEALQQRFAADAYAEAHERISNPFENGQFENDKNLLFCEFIKNGTNFLLIQTIYARPKHLVFVFPTDARILGQLKIEFGVN